MSLGTTDRAEAEFKAAPFIHHYRIAMFLWRKHKQGPIVDWSDLDRELEAVFKEPDTNKRQEMFDGWHAKAAAKRLPPLMKTTISRQYHDGLQIIDSLQAVVDGARITFFGADGRPVRTAGNPEAHTLKVPEVEEQEVARPFLYFDSKTILPEQFMPKPKTPDDTIIETYIGERKLHPSFAADARSTWELYKQTIGKPLSKATRKDGKELVRALKQSGLARATIQKKVGWLAAACTHAIKDGTELGINPFAGILPPPEREAIVRSVVHSRNHKWRYAIGI